MTRDVISPYSAFIRSNSWRKYLLCLKTNGIFPRIGTRLGPGGNLLLLRDERSKYEPIKVTNAMKNVVVSMIPKKVAIFVLKDSTDS